MSGGSHNYLCYAEMPDIIGRTADMEEMEKDLIKLGYTDAKYWQNRIFNP